MNVLLVHGAGGGGWEWGLWQRVLTARGFRSAAPDLRPAVAGVAATRIEDYLQQTRAAIAQLPHPRAVVGASLGGLLAAACGEAADALVLVNPLPPAPWAHRLPQREWADVVPWGRNARLASTRAAIPDCDTATALHAFRRWRDESGAVLRAAHAGIPMARPVCSVLVVVSAHDEDVPPALTRELAQAWEAQLLDTSCTSHVGPLMGHEAATVASLAADWLSAR